ncbi:MAG: hypothetical protein ACFFDF_25670 [Candidatus Odinarchaeota archaeon]
MFNLKRDFPWFFSYLENYYHLFLDVRFNNKTIGKKDITFTVEFSLQGFEGLIFYMYKPAYRRIKFDLYRHSMDQAYIINDLQFTLSKQSLNLLDFVIIPFGYFKDEHKFNLDIRSKDLESSFNLYAWAPSNLYKHVKSVIRIANQYSELIPIDDYRGYFFQFNSSFKGNETGRLFDLVNLLVDMDKTVDELDNSPLFEAMDSEIKSLVTKTNEFLFELCQRSIPLDIKNILRELERLKFNIDNLSKEEIFNWLDDLISYYSLKK